MSRPKLITDETPMGWRLVLWPYQFSASLGLAVILIVALAATLAIGTFVEAAYGTPAAQYFVYQTWWFNALMAFLAINIFCAAAIRYPWKRYQTGFVITHIGLLTLIFGATLSRLKGIDSQLLVFEHHTEKYAFDTGKMHFELEEIKDENGVHDHSQHGKKKADVTSISFDPGPYNWPDYANNFHYQPDAKPSDQPAEEKSFLTHLSEFPMNGSRYAFGWMTAARFRPQPGDVLYDRNGVKVEVLNYFSNSREVLAPAVDIKISVPARSEFDENGKPVPGKVMWQPVSLAVNPIADQPQYPYGIGDSKRVGGGNVVLMLAGNETQTHAFNNSTPEGELGDKGQIVLHVGKKKFTISVDDKFGAEPFPLEGTDLHAEVTEYFPTARPEKEANSNRIVFKADPKEREIPINPVVQVKLTRGDKPAGEVWLSAISPELNVHDYKNNIYGDYWYDYSRWNVLQELAKYQIGSRIDILQTQSEKLHYRYYNRKDVVVSPLPTSGDANNTVDAFKMPIAQLRMYVDDFVPSSKPEFKTIPLKFSREMNQLKRSAAHVRFTVDGNTEEFWLEAYRGDPDIPASGRSVRREIQGKDRTVALTLPVDAINVGFRVRLREFERKLDPGTSTAAHFSSTVDLLDVKTDKALYYAWLPSDGINRFELPAEIADLKDAAGIAIADNGETTFLTDREKGSLYAVKDGKHWEVTERDEDDENIKHAIVGPVAVAKKKQWVYWVESYQAGGADRNIIRRAEYSGDKVRGASAALVPAWLNHLRDHEAVVQVIGSVADIAIDNSKGKLYWINSSRSVIGRCELDGSDPEPEFISDCDSPGGIAIFEDEELIYWTEPLESKIRYAPLDDPTETTVFARLSHDQSPFRRVPVNIACDASRLAIVWSEIRDEVVQTGLSEKPTFVNHAIMSAPVTGGDGEPVCEDGVSAPGDVAVVDGKAVWVQEAAMARNVWITMNAPVEATDPLTGRTFRVFQEAFNGPFRPGDRTYDALMPADSPDEELYSSVLTVNYDPGRGIRNIGCLLIVAGIATMFYMRAYFFTGKKSTAKSDTAKKQQEVKKVVMAD